MRVIGVVTIQLALVGAAGADELGAPDPAQSPGFVNMLRQDGSSRAGGEVSYVGIADEPNLTLLRFDFHGHYVDANTGVGGYAQLPITSASGAGDSVTAFGNLQLGALYTPRLATSEAGIVLRGGLTLPTGSTDGDADVANVYGTFVRLTDLYTTIRDEVVVHLSASPMVRSGHYYARIDLGIDVPVYNTDNRSNPDVGMLVNLGAGIDLGSAAIMGEVSTLRLTEGTGTTINIGALSVRGHVGAVEPYAAVMLPLDDDLEEMLDLGLTAGIEARF